MKKQDHRIPPTAVFWVMITISLCILPAFSFAAPSTRNTEIPLSPTISSYDEVYLDIATIHQDHQRARRIASDGKMQISFAAFGKTYTLNLHRSTDMIGKDFKVEYHTPSGIEYPPVDIHVFYRGYVKGHAISDARATIRGGKFKSTIFVDDDILFLEPSQRFSRNIRSTHVAYWASSFCGVSDHLHEPNLKQLIDNMREKSHAHKRQYQYDRKYHRRGFQGDPDKSTCLMALVSDHRFHQSNGQGEVGATAQIMIEWLDFINRIFRGTDFGGNVGLGIQLAASRVIVFSTPEATDNLFQESTNSPFRFLDQLGGRRWGGFCLAHAFTNQDFAEGVVGLANVGTICRAPTNGFTSSGSGLTVFSTNTGITTTVNFGSTNSELQTLLVFAHEVGHNFGMPHDDQCGSFCNANPDQCSGNTVQAPGGRFIMWPQSVDGSQPNNNVFSGCSRETARARINTGSGAGGFCFVEPQTVFCGNGVLESGEECDCGADCENDDCCDEECNLINGAECSDQSGSCCKDCKMIGVDLANIMAVQNASVSLESLQEKPCASEADCYLPRICIKDPQLFGQCPSVHYSVFNNTFPSVCTENDDINICHIFHKPYGTICNEGSNICIAESDGCSGSLCSLFEGTDVSGQIPTVVQEDEPVQCFSEGRRGCEISCEFQKGVCASTFEYATTDHGRNMTISGVAGQQLNGTFRAPGRPCNAFTGVCTQDGKCFATSGVTPFDIFLDGSTLDWIIEHWYVTWAVLVGVTIGAFGMRAMSRNKGGRIVIKETEKRKSLWQTLRSSKRRGAVKRDKKHNQIVVELEKQNETPPNEALYRLKALFPHASDNVLHTVIKCSPHEEAAVFRLLNLGYAMRKLDDYKFLAFAGKKFRQDQRKGHLQQLQERQRNERSRGNAPVRAVGFAAVGSAPNIKDAHLRIQHPGRR
eukprot:gene97-3490_t